MSKYVNGAESLSSDAYINITPENTASGPFKGVSANSTRFTLPNKLLWKEGDDGMEKMSGFHLKRTVILTIALFSTVQRHLQYMVISAHIFRRWFVGKHRVMVVEFVLLSKTQKTGAKHQLLGVTKTRLHSC